MLIINDVSHNTAETGRFATTTRGGTLTVTNGYNLRGWLTSIESTPFREYLYYEQPHNGSTAQYGGNISSMDWKTGDNILRGYTFQYDGLSRLTGAAYSENGSASTHYGTSYQYDLMGNITGLTRNGLQDDNSYGLIDNLSFDYNGNQLLKVTDAVTSGPNYSGAFHFNDHSNASIEYTYDANGNMTKDRNKYIMSVTYNTLNLPVDVLYEDNSYTYSTSFHYAGDGRSLRVNHSLKKIKPLFPFKGFSGLDDIQKVVFPGIIKPNPAEMYNGDEFCGSLTYHSGTISYMSVDGGYVTFNSGTPTYHFYIHDHLGNNRVVVNESGTVEQVNHYYPYGGLMGESTGGDIQKYKYNGKRLERNHGLDWYDYGARHYDAAIVSWPTMDPLAEKYYSLSPYVYCFGNPIIFIDPNGTNPIYDTQGNFLGTDEFGLSGYYYVMEKSLFKQGMSHIEVSRNAILGDLSDEVVEIINNHYSKLPNRPDYDGFVTIGEGIDWAKKHPYALKNPTPDNMLYIDASQLDFGILSTNDFSKIGVVTPQNLFVEENIIESFSNPQLMATVYALGRVNMVLLNREYGIIRVVNDNATDYDWNEGGGTIRNLFIQINNFLFGIDPQKHGFKTYYYGYGRLRE